MFVCVQRTSALVLWNIQCKEEYGQGAITKQGSVDDACAALRDRACAAVRTQFCVFMRARALRPSCCLQEEAYHIHGVYLLFKLYTTLLFIDSLALHHSFICSFIVHLLHHPVSLSIFFVPSLPCCCYMYPYQYNHTCLCILICHVSICSPFISFICLFLSSNSHTFTHKRD